MHIKGNLLFNGSTSIAKGSRIIVGKNGTLEFGNNVSLNANSIVNACNSIYLGDNFLGGWNMTIIDGDGHTIKNLSGSEVTNIPKPIRIGNQCWVAANATILKGVSLSNNTIIPYGSIVYKSCDSSNVIFGGNPNRVIKHGIDWSM